jgi:hypothetical protein
LPRFSPACVWGRHSYLVLRRASRRSQALGGVRISQLAIIETSDSVSPDCLTAVGQYGRDHPQGEAGVRCQGQSQERRQACSQGTRGSLVHLSRWGGESAASLLLLRGKLRRENPLRTESRRTEVTADCDQWYATRSCGRSWRGRKKGTMYSPKEVLQKQSFWRCPIHKPTPRMSPDPALNISKLRNLRAAVTSWGSGYMDDRQHFQKSKANEDKRGNINAKCGTEFPGLELERFRNQRIALLRLGKLGDDDEKDASSYRESK